MAVEARDPEIRVRPLAEMILQGKIHDGERVAITAGKDGLLFNGEAAKMKAA